MTQIKMGSEEYRRLLREWSYWDRLACDGLLTEQGERRLKEINYLLADAELAFSAITALHSEEGAASA